MRATTPPSAAPQDIDYEAAYRLLELRPGAPPAEIADRAALLRAAFDADRLPRGLSAAALARSCIVEQAAEQLLNYWWTHGAASPTVTLPPRPPPQRPPSPPAAPSAPALPAPAAVKPPPAAASVHAVALKLGALALAAAALGWFYYQTDPAAAKGPAAEPPTAAMAVPPAPPRPTGAFARPEPRLPHPGFTAGPFHH